MKSSDFDNYFKEKVADSENIHKEAALEKKENVWDAIVPEKPKRRLVPFLSIAASIALLIGAYFFYQNTMVSDEIVIASLEEIKEITLPDSSKVWLNKHSELSYSKDFETRDLKLNGEAFFEIKRDESRPFIIYTMETKTTVLGTSFNINSDDKAVKITVVTGKVAFENINNSVAKKVELVKGELATLDAVSNKIILSDNVDVNFLAWKDQKIIFDETPLAEIEKILEDYFGVEIEIVEKRIYAKRGTGTFVDPTLENVLMVLSHGLGLQYKKVDNKYVITSNEN